jgi:hypothetical protein
MTVIGTRQETAPLARVPLTSHRPPLQRTKMFHSQAVHLDLGNQPSHPPNLLATSRRRRSVILPTRSHHGAPTLPLTIPFLPIFSRVVPRRQRYYPGSNPSGGCSRVSGFYVDGLSPRK